MKDTTKKKKNKINKWPYIFISPYFITYLIFSLFPIIFTLGISFTDWNGIDKMDFVGLKNYINLFTTDPYFLKSILTTVQIIVMYLPIVVILGMVMSVVLYEMRPKIAHTYRILSFLPYITTPVAIGIIFSTLFDYKAGTINQILIQLGLFNEGVDWLGGKVIYTKLVIVILLVWQNLGYYIVMYSAGLCNIGDEIYEAAEIDGASKFQKMIKITMPLLKPVTAFLVITSIIWALQLFDQPRLLIMGNDPSAAAGGIGRRALTTIWYFYDMAFGTRMEYGKAASVSYGLFLFILTFSILGIKAMKRGDSANVKS